MSDSFHVNPIRNPYAMPNGGALDDHLFIEMLNRTGRSLLATFRAKLLDAGEITSPHVLCVELMGSLLDKPFAAILLGVGPDASEYMMNLPPAWRNSAVIAGDTARHLTVKVTGYYGPTSASRAIHEERHDKQHEFVMLTCTLMADNYFDLVGETYD